LIRPKAPKSQSPFNFDIVLLDHGQYFDIDDDLRVNYARFWLSLISPETPKNLAKRKYYAKLVANVDDDLVGRKLQLSIVE
jgi:aarF domain-containing kinase